MRTTTTLPGWSCPPSYEPEDQEGEDADLFGDG